jgi:hypothetical protein
LRISWINNVPAFLFLLPFFFVLHGVSEHLNFIPIADAFILLAKYLLVAVLLCALFLPFFKNVISASVASAFSLAIFFFFGAIHDFLAELSFLSFFSKYSVLLTILFVLYVLGLIKLRKGVRQKFVFYLNALFILLVAFDAAVMIKRTLEQKSEKILVTPCSGCRKPDVYLVLLDGYAGQKQLVNEFSFSNEFFLQQLRQVGFFVMDSSFSNYGDTPFSMSSMLNMKYLGLKDYQYSDKNLDYCFEQIAHNRVVTIFDQLGYRFINNSIFDIQGQPSPIDKTFLISGIQLISSQTLFGRLKRDVYANVVGKYFPESALNKDIVFADLRNNEKIYERTIEISKRRTEAPRFIYSHLLMPHFPYYYNSTGVLNPFSELLPNNLYNETLYLEYLKYCNKRILNLVISILKYSKEPPVILLIGDHGFRKDNNYNTRYSNLAAVYLPDGKYSAYRKDLSNVNQFPVLFNTILNQNFPLSEDKIVE